MNNYLYNDTELPELSEQNIDECIYFAASESISVSEQEKRLQIWKHYFDNITPNTLSNIASSSFVGLGEFINELKEGVDKND